MEDKSNKSGVPDRETVKTVVWMAHCINFPFIPLDRNMQINLAFMSKLKEFKQAVQSGDKDATADTLNTLTEFFVETPWFDGMPEQEEWLKPALECMMATGNGDLGGKVLERLQACGGLPDEEKEELMAPVNMRIF